MTESPRGLPIRDTIRVKSIRKAMAQTMKASVDAAALSQVTRDVDVTSLQSLRKTLQKQRQEENTDSDISINTLLMTAIARTLPAHPLLNAELVERDILVYDTVNLGMAVATPAGLIVVVVLNAASLSLEQMALTIDQLAERARNGKLTMEDVEGGTFTASNLGMYGVDGGFPIPRSPEGAIILLGAARNKPAVVDDEIVVRQVAQFSLTFDHRFIDGATAAAFLQDLNSLILNPESLLDAP
jgi:pyruvate dehydrogenase E2 component (dihydrolipoamide acetyltransferase)